LSAFAFYALTITVTCGVTVIGASGLRREPLGKQLAVALVVGGVHAALFVTRPSTLWLSNGFVLATSIWGAALISRTVRTAPALVALALAASVADMVSFSGGPTRWLLDSEGLRGGLAYLAVSLPRAEGTVAVVGIGDLLLFGSFFLALSALDRPPRWVFAALIVALWFALAVGLARGGAFGIPFMAAAVLVLLRWPRHLTPPAT